MFGSEEYGFGLIFKKLFFAVFLPLLVPKAEGGLEPPTSK
jgi:hypothetical protein